MLGKIGVLNPFKNWKKGDLPCDPTITLVLNEYGTQKDGLITISSSLATDSEIDFAADLLLKDIESARKHAKKILRAQKEKIRKSLNSGDFNA
jgi:hypothetical protein